ncbi:MAG: hypothetical protein ACLQU5_09555 [Isosphaeraceae bacterium]
MGWVTLEDGQHVLIGSSGKVLATRSQISSAGVKKPGPVRVGKASNIVGYRFHAKPAGPGERLKRSHVWNDDVPTSKRLPGTAAFKTEAEARAHGARVPGHVVALTGKIVSRPHGRDELRGEISIKNARVQSILASNHHYGKELGNPESASIAVLHDMVIRHKRQATIAKARATAKKA